MVVWLSVRALIPKNKPGNNGICTGWYLSCLGLYSAPYVVRTTCLLVNSALMVLSYRGKIYVLDARKKYTVNKIYTNVTYRTFSGKV